MKKESYFFAKMDSYSIVFGKPKDSVKMSSTLEDDLALLKGNLSSELWKYFKTWIQKFIDVIFLSGKNPLSYSMYRDAVVATELDNDISAHLKFVENQKIIQFKSLYPEDNEKKIKLAYTKWFFHCFGWDHGNSREIE